MTRYRLAGIVLETDWPLITRIPEAGPGPSPDLTFRVQDESPINASLDPLRIEEVGDLWMVSDQEWIFHLTHPEHDYQVEIYLLGFFLSRYLEQEGIAVLHGSAATAGSYAVGFLGPNGTGKTSLALSLMDAGERLLTDNLLAVPVRDGAALAEPTFPQVRLWPEEAERRLGSTNGLSLAHPNYEKLRVPIPDESFSPEAVPLSVLYLPRRGGDIQFEEVRGPKALFSLMFESFAPWFSNLPQHRPEWITRTASLLEVVSVFTLAYPDAVESLPEVAEAVQTHSQAALQSKRIGGTAASKGA